MAHKRSKDSHLTVSKLSRMSAKELRAIDHLEFVMHGHETLAVLIPYDQYMEMQHYLKVLMREANYLK